MATANVPPEITECTPRSSKRALNQSGSETPPEVSSSKAARSLRQCSDSDSDSASASEGRVDPPREHGGTPSETEGATPGETPPRDGVTTAAHEGEEQEAGWITATNRRRRPRPKFRFLTGQDLAESYRLITGMELDNPSLKLEVRPNLRGEYIFTPKDDASESRLRELSENDERLVLLDPRERQQRMVVERYPHSLPLEAVEAHQ